MHLELLLLVVSLLFFVSILVSKAGSRLGVPVLLLFLGVGMLFGSDGLGIHFDNLTLAQGISTIALCIILFSGGMDTKFEDIKPVIGPGLSLATVGVFVTAFSTGFLIWLIMDKTSLGGGIGLLSSLLLASTMSSTDSASVFSILRSKGLRLKHNLRPILELESGSNDPMAYVLTITFINLVSQPGTPNYVAAVLMVFTQLAIGAVVGLAIGKVLVWFVNKVNIDNSSLYPILVFSSCIFIFAATYFLKGNSYLAVYLGGLVVGNSKFVHKRSTRSFFDGLSWLSQLSMFLTLGLLVNPSELKPMILPGLFVSLIMMFVTRPLSVFLSLAPFRQITVRDKVYVSWVGLRGAVPIIFAILCRAADVPHSHELFNIVFVCTLVSLVLQGTTISAVANWLGIAEPPTQDAKAGSFDIDFPEEIKSASLELEITDRVLAGGNRLMDLKMPEKTLAIMVKRNEQYFVPTGKTVLKRGDRLMLLSDNNEELVETLQRLGVEPPKPPTPTLRQRVKSKHLIDILEYIEEPQPTAPAPDHIDLNEADEHRQP
ncbi:MAG: potassium/proton antiporter [Bacteroidales bacterium]|nr:potassium/proton antiporter [Bacteroidales bacterium]